MRFQLKEDYEKQLKVEDITLLSTEEAEKLPKDILKFSNYWWLRSPGRWQDSVTLVSIDGGFGDYGLIIDKSDFGVRPALIVSNLNSLNLNLYDKIEFYGVKWIKISGNMLLCNDTTFGNHCFDPSDYWNWNAPQYTYENSDIYKYIHDKWKEIKKSAYTPVPNSVYDFFKDKYERGL